MGRFNFVNFITGKEIFAPGCEIYKIIFTRFFRLSFAIGVSFRVNYDAIRIGVIFKEFIVEISVLQILFAVHDTTAKEFIC